MALTPRQKAFVDAWDGTRPGWECAQAAGYTGSKATLEQRASRLRNNPTISLALKMRGETPGKFLPSTEQVTTLASQVMGRLERQAMWTAMARDVAADPKDRLRASELLAKSEGDFIERVEVSGKLTLQDLVLAAVKKP